MSFVNLSRNPITNWSKKQTDAIEKYCSEDSAIFCLANTVNNMNLKEFLNIESEIPGGFCKGMVVLIEPRFMLGCYLATHLQDKGCTVIEADYDEGTFIKFLEYPSFNS